MFPTLNDEQRQFIATVRGLAQSMSFASARRALQDSTFPCGKHEIARATGPCSAWRCPRYGGLGLPVFDTALVLEEIAKVCYVTAMAVLGEVGAQTRIISTYAPEAIKKRVLPAVCSGECLLAICMTEPDAGTDVANYRTNVDHVGNKLRLNGVKTLFSRAEEAGWLSSSPASTKKPGREGIGCVLVEKGTPGFSVTGTYHTMGGENLAEIRFEDVRAATGKPGARRRVPQIAGRLQHRSVASTRRSRSGGSPRARSKRRSNTPRNAMFSGRAVADFQGMRWKLAEMYRDIEASRSIYRACATANPFPDPLLAAAAKITVNEMSLRVTSEAIQVHGGYGFTDEYPVSRFYRGARYGSLGGGTSETLKDLIGRRVLAGIDPIDGILGLGAF